MSERASPEEVKRLLIEVLPSECRLVGSDNLSDLMAGDTEFDDDEDVFHMNVRPSREEILAAAGVVR